jgi:beta-glucosidase
MRIKFMFVALILIAMTSRGQDIPEYFNPENSIEDRIQDLISKMTLEEKVSQMMYNSVAINRLNIPEYNWWNEALHGVARSGRATVFPQAIGMGATFDRELIFRVADAISDEARAMYNASVKMGYRNQYGGLTFWTPNINIFRDPRWGRGQETYGEDPFLTGQIGSAFVKGLQGNNPRYLKTAACAKHFAVHSGPEKLRHEFNAKASEKDLYETYLPAFKMLVDSGVESVMCAYNRTNDEPCCANNYLIKDVLRGKWNFQGHVVSDCWALVDFFKGHKVCENAEQAAAMALKAGVNLNCGSVFPFLVDAAKQGLVTEEEINQSLSVLLKTRFKLGLFDPQGSNPYDKIPVDVIDSEKHRALAREVAQKSMVLLKNNNVLPLKNNLSKYYVTGPNATSIECLLGNYHGVNGRMVTFMEGIVAAVETGSQVQYRPGILLNQPNTNPIDYVMGDAIHSDATIVVLGINSYLEGEEGESLLSPYAGDRLEYNLPANQVEFLKKIALGNNNPVIAVITGGSPMNLSEIHQYADAVILAWYPGEEGGTALADILFGKVSPSGKLPITFPKSFDQLPSYEDYSMKGRTYRYMEQEPLYPFGFGLTYSTFEFSKPEISSNQITTKSRVEISTKISNTGKFESDEVVQLYVTKVDTNIETPLFSLKGMKRIHLKPGESGNLKFDIEPAKLETVNSEGNSILEKGKYKIYLGTSLPTQRSLDLGSNQFVSAELEVK